MKSKIVALLLASTMLMSCNSTVSTAQAQGGRFAINETSEDSLLVVTDTSTGCMYLVFREYSTLRNGSGMGWGGMCQLTDADGKPLLSGR